jgi:hypothetical protein
MVWQAFGLNDAASLQLSDAGLASQPVFRFQNCRLGQAPDTSQQAQTEDERPDPRRFRHRRSKRTYAGGSNVIND